MQCFEAIGIVPMNNDSTYLVMSSDRNSSIESDWEEQLLFGRSRLIGHA